MPNEIGYRATSGYPSFMCITDQKNMSIEDLFINYRGSFDALDSVLISENYRLPCSISDADGCQVFTDRAALLNKFSANSETMKSMTYKSSEFNILNLDEMGDSAQAATIGWRVQLADDVIEFRCLYICHFVDNRWKIFNANVYTGAFE